MDEGALLFRVEWLLGNWSLSDNKLGMMYYFLNRVSGNRSSCTIPAEQENI